MYPINKPRRRVDEIIYRNENLKLYRRRKVSSFNPFILKLYLIPIFITLENLIKRLRIMPAVSCQKGEINLHGINYLEISNRGNKILLIK